MTRRKNKMPTETTITPEKKMLWTILQALKDDATTEDKIELGRLGSWLMLSLTFAKPQPETHDKFVEFMREILGVCELGEQLTTFSENMIDEMKKLVECNDHLNTVILELQENLAKEKDARRERETSYSAHIEEVRNSSEDKIKEIEEKLRNEKKAREEMKSEFEKEIEAVKEKAKKVMEFQLEKLQKSLEEKIENIELKN